MTTAVVTKSSKQRIEIRHEGMKDIRHEGVLILHEGIQGIRGDKNYVTIGSLAE